MTKQKKNIIIVTSLVVLIAALSVYAVFLWNNQNAEKAPAAAEEEYTAVEMPKVYFASYRMAEGIPVTLAATSVERDLSISILDEDFQPVTNVGFEVIATPPVGEPLSFKDEEYTGKIYADDLEPGEYTLALVETGRFIVPEPLSVEVKKKVETKVIENISEQLVNSKNVDASSEDAKFGGGSQPPVPPPPPPKDTVPFYETRIVDKTIDVPVTITLYIPVLTPDGYMVYKDSYLASLSYAANITLQPVMAMSMLLLSDDPPTEPPEPPVTPEKYKPVTDNDGGLIAVVSDSGARIENMEQIKNMFQYTESTITKIEKKIEKIYQGWHTIDGKRYYFTLEGKPVTGSQVIQGMSYVFDSNGVLQQNTTKELRGVDVSTWQNTINWTAVKNSGIHFVMVRAGYRGYTQGALIEDDKFKSHAQGAQAAGIKVGLYYFSQAINEREAVEEASAAVAIARKYGIAVSYPIAIDMEYINSARIGRGDNISGAQRTANAKAFCDTIRNAGYTPMIYASKSWFESPAYLDINQLSQYRIWLAHWGVAQTSYNRSRIDIWQYTSSGSVPGITGRVDMNISYMGY